MQKIFLEKQKFTQWWIWAILLVPIFFHISEVSQMSFIYLTVMLLVIVFIYSITLTVIVKPDGLHYQFFPIHFKTYILKISQKDNK